METSDNWREWIASIIGTTIVAWIATRKREDRMEKAIVGAPIGPEAKIDLKLKDGAIVIEVTYKGADGYGSLAVGVVPDAFIDKLAAMIPGTLDDAIFAALKGALK